MALISKTFSLDITPGAMPPVIHVSEYDVNREFTINLRNGVGSFTPATGTTATIEGTLNGYGFSEDATISGNAVTFTLTESMTASAGKAWVKVKLIKDDAPVSSAAFILDCDRAGVEAETVIGASGFEDQITDAVTAWLDEHGASGLPSGGQAGQVLVSDGHGGGVWVDWEGGGGSVIEFDDRNDYVINYLTASASYTAANRSSVSVIQNYASTTIQDQDCPIPYDGVYNLMPGVETEIGHVTVIRKDVAPRMLKLDNVWNVRDCGGWSADGGKVRYGKLFRGARLNNASSDDLALLAAVGIKLDLDIRDSGNASGSTPIPGASYTNVALTNAYAQMIQSEATAAANAVQTAMQSIVNGNPVYIHCASGADRTGCICAMLEAVLGMSDADIDRDFELTCFADSEDLTGHRRNGGSWTGFWSALPTNQGNAKLNVAKFLRDNGVTTALLNSFRQAMIDGTPSDIDAETKSITNNLTGCTTSNNASSVVANASYSATITPNSGYTLATLTVTMGGVDITSTAVSGGTITIASVTGNVVITALAEEQTSYTNLVRTSQAVDSTSVYNGVGYKNGYYLDSGSGAESANASDCMTGCIPYGDGTKTQTDIIYIKGYTGTAGASHTRLCSRNSSKTKISVYTGFLSSNSLFSVETLGTGYYKLTPQSGTFVNVEWLQFSFNQADGSGIIITKNEPIE